MWISETMYEKTNQSYAQNERRALPMHSHSTKIMIVTLHLQLLPSDYCPRLHKSCLFKIPQFNSIHHSFSTVHLRSFSDLTSSSVDPGHEETNCLRHSPYIIQMSWQDGESSNTNCITSVADNLSLGRVKIWNATSILLITGIAIGDDARDASFHGCGAIFYSTMNESCALTVFQISIRVHSEKEKKRKSRKRVGLTSILQQQFEK